MATKENEMAGQLFKNIGGPQPGQFVGPKE